MSLIRDCTRISNSKASLVDTVDLEIIDPITKLAIKEIQAEPLSILIISSQEFCERLKPVLQKLSTEKYGGNLRIKLAEDVEQLFESGINSTSVDFVALVCDTTILKSCKQLLSNIDRLESIVATRAVIVNGSPKNGIEGSALDISRLAESRNILYFNGQIRDEGGCKRVAERLMALAASSCGYYTGLPFVYPTSVEVFAQMCGN